MFFILQTWNSIRPENQLPMSSPPGPAGRPSTFSFHEFDSFGCLTWGSWYSTILLWLVNFTQQNVLGATVGSPVPEFLSFLRFHNIPLYGGRPLILSDRIGIQVWEALNPMLFSCEWTMLPCQSVTCSRMTHVTSCPKGEWRAAALAALSTGV